jgi:hypothetical protein
MIIPSWLLYHELWSFSRFFLFMPLIQPLLRQSDWAALLVLFKVTLKIYWTLILFLWVYLWIGIFYLWFIIEGSCNALISQFFAIKVD